MQAVVISCNIPTLLLVEVCPKSWIAIFPIFPYNGKKRKEGT